MIYPIILRLILLFRKDKIDIDKDFQPNVSIIISIYNEEGFIRDCLDSLIECNYPNEKLNILVGSDGSTDMSNEIVSEYETRYPFIRLFEFDRGGKNNVLNSLFPFADTDIVYFMDADTRVQKNTLKDSVSILSANDVASVLVNVRSTNLTGDIDESYYQKLESRLRQYESDIYTTVNSTGQFYGVKSVYLDDLSDTTICDDYVPVLNAISQGKKIKFLKQISVLEFREKSISDEVGRRERVSGGGLSTIFKYKKALNPLRISGFFLVSHKIIRYLMPYTYIFSLLSSIALAVVLGSYWILIFAIIALPLFLYVIKLITGNLFTKYRIFQYSEFLLTMLYGMHKGWIGFIKGRNNAIWTH